MDAIIVAIISATVSLIGIFVTSRNTRDEVTKQLDKNHAILSVEVEHIKQNMAEMKSDIKEHNNYAKMFNENIPVIKEQIKVANHRIDDLEHKL